jgi:hypothetical protein
LALSGVVLGSLLGFVSEVVRERRLGKRAARLVIVEIVENITVLNSIRRVGVQRPSHVSRAVWDAHATEVIPSMDLDRSLRVSAAYYWVDRITPRIERARERLAGVPAEHVEQRGDALRVALHGMLDEAIDDFEEALWHLQVVLLPRLITLVPRWRRQAEEGLREGAASGAEAERARRKRRRASRGRRHSS